MTDSETTLLEACLTVDDQSGSALSAVAGHFGIDRLNGLRFAPKGRWQVLRRLLAVLFSESVSR